MTWGPIKNHPGYVGAFTRNQVLGGFRNGTRVVKVKNEEGDTHKIGEFGTVLGSIFHKDISPHVFYFVEWDDAPGIVVGCVGWKLDMGQH